MKPILLMRTPMQKLHESPMGYLLRVSEANGYESTWRLFQFAGVSQFKMRGAGVAMDEIARVLGKVGATVTGYRAPGEADPSAVTLNGNALIAKDLELNRARVCPECVLERGFIPSWTDLAVVDACPEHQRKLVSNCPSCRAGLTWFRPGLLKCRCGHRFSAARGEPISAEHAAVLSHVVSKVEGTPAVEGGGVPGGSLSKMSLRGLLRLVVGLAQFDEQVVPSPGASAAARAGKVLSNWPRGLYTLLSGLGLRAGPTKALGLRKQFESFFNIVLKFAPEPESVAFVKQAFVQFGAEHWGQVTVDAKLLKSTPAGKDAEVRFKSLGGIAEHLGVRQITARRWFEKGLIEGKVVEGAVSRRYVVDEKKLTLARRAEGKALNVRDAAKAVGLPVSVLKSLRESGHFEVRHLGRMKASFHEADVRAFSLRLEALHAGPFVVADSTVSMTGAMLRKFGSDEGKADLVRQLLDAKVAPAASTGVGLENLRVDEALVTRLAELSRAQAGGDYLAITQASRLLGCEISVATNLAKLGHLERKPGPEPLRVSSRSVHTFAEEYVTVTLLARALGTTSAALGRRLDRANVSRLIVPRGVDGSPQSFVRRIDAERLRSEIGAA